MTDSTDVFYFEVRVYRVIDSNYHTVGFKTCAQDIQEASKFFLAWASGVQSAPTCSVVRLISVLTTPVVGRSYLWPTDIALQSEIRHFLVGGTDPNDRT